MVDGDSVNSPPTFQPQAVSSMFIVEMTCEAPAPVDTRRTYWASIDRRADTGLAAARPAAGDADHDGIVTRGDAHALRVARVQGVGIELRTLADDGLGVAEDHVERERAGYRGLLADRTGDDGVDRRLVGVGRDIEIALGRDFGARADFGMRRIGQHVGRDQSNDYTWLTTGMMCIQASNVLIISPQAFKAEYFINMNEILL